jgi:hypothetical protein
MAQFGSLRTTQLCAVKSNCMHTTSSIGSSSRLCISKLVCISAKQAVRTLNGLPSEVRSAHPGTRLLHLACARCRPVSRFAPARRGQRHSHMLSRGVKVALKDASCGTRTSSALARQSGSTDVVNASLVYWSGSAPHVDSCSDFCALPGLRLHAALQRFSSWATDASNWHDRHIYGTQTARKLLARDVLSILSGGAGPPGAIRYRSALLTDRRTGGPRDAIECRGRCLCDCGRWARFDSEGCGSDSAARRKCWTPSESLWLVHV